ncbi:MAG: HAD-IA family hydrolase [Planctomycetota bacterium]|nr:HAD-IA family hydrolase [Planctomycetota bacterium]
MAIAKNKVFPGFSFPAMVMDLEGYYRYEALIFDCDGTLTDSMPLHYVAWKDAFLTEGMAFTEETFYSLAGMPGEKVIAAVAEESGCSVTSETALRLLAFKDRAFLAKLDQLLPLDFTVDIARRLHGQMPMAVASGGTREDVKSQLRHLNIQHLFETVVAAEDTLQHKPHPAVFQEAAKRLGKAADRCLVFEDGNLGIEAAIRAGMDYVDVREYRQNTRLTPEIHCVKPG